MVPGNIYSFFEFLTVLILSKQCFRSAVGSECYSTLNTERIIYVALIWG